MLSVQRACKTLGVLSLLFAFTPLVFSQTNTNYFATQGGEYNITGNLIGDQVNPALAINTKGGFLVWEDNATDGDGLGVSAVQLSSTFSAQYGAFRVNAQGAGDQENPQVALLSGGGAVFVWQGGQQGYQHIFARLLSSNNIWMSTNDIEVNTATNYYQTDPAVAVLANGYIIVTWTSYGQDNADGFAGVYGQILSPAGSKIGGEFLINQFTPYNQRSSTVAAFPNGSFVVAWISEQERSSVQTTGGTVSGGYNSVDVYARTFNSSGTALVNEFLVNNSSNICANPTVAAASDNTCIIAWSQLNAANTNNNWDVWSRRFDSGNNGGTVAVVNTQLYGDQYAPKLSSLGTSYMAVWTSMGQDGSYEGVYAQFLNDDGSHSGGEMRVNTTVLNGQKFPCVASDGSERFMVAWSSYVNSTYGMDLFGQRYASTVAPLSAPSAPIVLPVNDQYTLSVTWPPVQGYSVSYYELYVDGSSTPIEVTNDLWGSDNFDPGTTHSFALAYVLTDGRQSPLSPTASATTWGRDSNHDGLPDNWQSMYWGANSANWPSPNSLLAPGVTVLDVFLWGANPLQPGTWLKQSITQTPQGMYLNWNTVPGGIYQVMETTNFTTWTPYGAPRFESGTTDSIPLGNSKGCYYKVVRNLF